MRFARLFSFGVLAAMAVSCDAGQGDPHADLGVPTAAGKDLHIKQITDPDSDHLAKDTQTVALSGAVVIAVDTYDETANGKSRGTIYVQDIGSRDPYSGLSLYSPTFVPGNLLVGPGDVLDLRGEFQQNQSIGTAMFAPGATLPQLSRPVATFRFESEVPDPVDIDVNDLADYAKGRKWLNMLVRVKNVTVLADVAESGNSPRVAAPLLPGNSGSACQDPFPKPPSLTNELANLNSLGIKANTQIKEIVGIVTFFCSLHLSPRSTDDVKIQ